MIFVGLKRYFISTISNHSLSVQLRVLTAETMEISASLNKLVVVKGQAGSTTEAVLFRSIFCKIRWEQQVQLLLQICSNSNSVSFHKEISNGHGLCLATSGAK